MEPTKEKVQSIIRGALIAAAGAGTYYAIAEFGALDYGPWTPTVVAVLGIVANIMRKFLGPDQLNRSDVPKRNLSLLVVCMLASPAEANTNPTCFFGSKRDYSPQLQQIADSTARISEQLAELRGYLIGSQGRIEGQGRPPILIGQAPYQIPQPQAPYQIPAPQRPYNIPPPGIPEYEVPQPETPLPVPEPEQPYNVPPPGIEDARPELPPVTPPDLPSLPEGGTTGSSFVPFRPIQSFPVLHRRIENPQWRPIR